MLSVARHRTCRGDLLSSWQDFQSDMNQVLGGRVLTLTMSLHPLVPGYTGDDDVVSFDISFEIYFLELEEIYDEQKNLF